MNAIRPENAYSNESQILEALDFNPEIECENDNCSGTQEWREFHKCCSSEWRICARCREVNLKLLRDTEEVNCIPCGFTWKPKRTIIIEWAKL